MGDAVSIRLYTEHTLVVRRDAIQAEPLRLAVWERVRRCPARICRRRLRDDEPRELRASACSRAVCIARRRRRDDAEAVAAALATLRVEQEAESINDVLHAPERA